MSAAVREASRAVRRVISSHVTTVGTVEVRRALPDRERHAVGPWVFLDHFGPYRPVPGGDGVGPHPHAGIETVTYLLSGRNRHRDSAGNEGSVGRGGAQWMTAGRGIVHSERPLVESPEDAVMHGIQLWTSLPRAAKLVEPEYQRIDAAAIPCRTLEGVTICLVAGELAGMSGPARTRMPLVLAPAVLEPGASLAAPVPPAFEMAAYVTEGRILAGENESIAASGELAVFDGEEEVIVLCNRDDEPAGVMLLGGTPAEGPLVFHGPFVMNSVEQVRAAEIAYRIGRMGPLTEE